MAYTVGIEGVGVIANADAATNDTGGDGTGDWGFTGSGGVSNGLTTDTFLYGSASISAALSGTKSGWLWFNMGTGTGYPLNFASGGNEEGQYIYIWVACPALGLTTAISTPGLAIRIGGSTSNYRTFTVGGNDDANGWNGGWKCFVIDPTATGSITDGGTYNANSIQYIGAYMSTNATAKGDNLFISQIAVGSGLRITGTDTTAWLTATNYCTDYPNRAWGMLEERGGIFYAKGNINIGGAVLGDGTADNQVTDFSDSGRVIQFEKSEYYISSAWASTVPTTAFGITLDDDGTYATTYTDGVVVGTDKGRSGSTIIGNDNENIFLDYSTNIANTSSLIENYGTTYKSLAGAINLEGDSDHEYFSVNFIDCSQVITNSATSAAPIIRNCTFAETQDTAGALIWDNDIDIQDCAFIANTTGPGIEHTDWNGSEDGTVTTADATGVTLHDSAATFTGNVAVNDIVYNETDNSFATVVTVDSNIQITTSGLSGGTDDQFASSDAYSITTPYDYTNLTFSGNTNDVDNTVTADNAVAISKAGTSDPSTYPTGDHVAIQGSVTVQVTVKDESGTAISTVQTAVYLTSDNTEILNADTNGSAVASTTYAGATPAEVLVRCRKASSGATKYKNFSSVQTIQSGSGLDFAVTMGEDPNNNATT